MCDDFMLMHDVSFISNFGTPKRIRDLIIFIEVKIFNYKKIYFLFFLRILKCIYIIKIQ